MDKALIVIPARKGSKGILQKNTKLLNNKPLIHYAFQESLACFGIEDICVSTNDEKVVVEAKSFGIQVPFLRPENLSNDKASMIDVLKHAINFFESNGKYYKTLILLQPTSPFRTALHIQEAYKTYKEQEVDMVVSVKESKTSPYFNLFEEDEQNLLYKSKKGSFFTRQEAPKVYELNGAIYIININSLKGVDDIALLSKKKKYVMDATSSFDLDTMFDWKMAELIIKEI